MLFIFGLTQDLKITISSNSKQQEWTNFVILLDSVPAIQDLSTNTQMDCEKHQAFNLKKIIDKIFNLKKRSTMKNALQGITPPFQDRHPLLH